jgi:mannose-6-phosphate isomerase-like protein (cupin superfamily)
MPVVDLRAQPIVPTPYGRWQPLNAPLQLDAVGVNAIVMDPGEDFDIEHDETDSGHQEVYVVVAGRALFRVGDEQIEAGPGTVVSAPEPSATRSYSALEPETRVVCIGVRPGATHPFGQWIDEARTD